MTAMMSNINSVDPRPTALLAILAAKTAVGTADVVALRQTSLAVGLASRDDAEAMMAIERSPSKKCREWGDLLVECLLDYLVWAERPTGALTDEQATWLCDQVGETPTPAALAVLIAVLEEAGTMPAWFAPAVRVRASKVFGADAWQPHQVAA